MITELQYLEAKKLIDEYQNQLEINLGFRHKKENYHTCNICKLDKIESEFVIKEMRNRLNWKKQKHIMPYCLSCYEKRNARQGIRRILNNSDNLINDKIQKINKIIEKFECTKVKCTKCKLNKLTCYSIENKINNLYNLKKQLTKLINKKREFICDNDDYVNLKVMITKLNDKLKKIQLCNQ